MTARRESVTQRLRRILAGKTLILGIGNRLREDDGVGPYFASLCARTNNLEAFDCGEAPEKYIGKAIREDPDAVLLADAVDFGGEPGDVSLLDVAAIQGKGISTHDISLKLLADYLANETHTNVAVLAFQPASTRLGRELSQELKQSAHKLAADLNLSGPAQEGVPGGQDENNHDR